MGLLQKNALMPTGGSIKLVGEELLTASDRRLRQLRATRMAMIFQEPMTALNPVVPVGRQIDEVLCAHTDLDARARRKRILDMMEQVRLPQIERIFASYPHRLSGGQRQRIMIAMALVLEPKLLIADEPTTALDVTTQKQILTLIRDLQRDHGTAVLFITHDMGVVAEIADRVAVMRNGRLVETGPLDSHPAHAHDGIYPQPALLGAEPGAARAARRHAASRSCWRQRASARSIASALSSAKPARSRPPTTSRSTLRKGRTLGIVGESGSGKSTVARCIVRLIDPTSGGIRLVGTRNLEPVAWPAATASQAHPDRVPGPLSLAQSARHHRREHRRGPDQLRRLRAAQAFAKARELLELVDLPPDAISRYPHQFSGGQRQRIAIARALALDPDVLVADEAVSALDVSVQAQVLELFAEIQKRLGIALLFITHDLRVAAQICDDVAVMQHGRIVEQGPAAEVLTHPQQAYTRTLLDAAPGRGWDFANFRPVAATALSSSLRAKRSNPDFCLGDHLDCFVASLLAMTRRVMQIRNCFAACACRGRRANVADLVGPRPLNDPHRRRRLPARDQHLRADEGDLRCLSPWRQLAADDTGRRYPEDHSPHQSRACRFHRSGGGKRLGARPDHLRRGDAHRRMSPRMPSSALRKS